MERSLEKENDERKQENFQQRLPFFIHAIFRSKYYPYFFRYSSLSPHAKRVIGGQKYKKKCAKSKGVNGFGYFLEDGRFLLV